jgi:hypothetical protein
MAATHNKGKLSTPKEVIMTDSIQRLKRTLSAR